MLVVVGSATRHHNCYPGETICNTNKDDMQYLRLNLI
jgi:hypothetical protein